MSDTDQAIRTLLGHLKELRAAGVQYLTFDDNSIQEKSSETPNEQGVYGHSGEEFITRNTTKCDVDSSFAGNFRLEQENWIKSRQKDSPSQTLSLFPENFQFETGMRMKNPDTPPLPYDPKKISTLDELASSVAGCLRCKLGPNRTNLVFGVGNPSADLVFVGEAPGKDEDLQGIPFVGRAGQMLTRMIENVIEIQRNEVYICNILKCRPPGNRNPETDEISCCEPYLYKQLELIKPRLIVALGKFAAQWLFQTKIPISKLRGKFGIYRGIPIIATYHPAYLLRNPSQKRTVMEDLLRIKSVYEKKLKPEIEILS